METELRIKTKINCDYSFTSADVAIVKSMRHFYNWQRWALPGSSPLCLCISMPVCVLYNYVIKLKMPWHTKRTRESMLT